MNQPQGCDGECQVIVTWRCECDCETEHIFISQYAVECRECQEIKEWASKTT